MLNKSTVDHILYYWSADMSFDRVWLQPTLISSGCWLSALHTLWNLLWLCGFLARIIGLLTGLYPECSVSFQWTRVRHGCLFSITFEHLYELVWDRAVDQTHYGASVGIITVSNSVFTDAVILAVARGSGVGFQSTQWEDTAPRTQVSWNNTKVQVFGGLLDETV